MKCFAMMIIVRPAYKKCNLLVYKLTSCTLDPPELKAAPLAWNEFLIFRHTTSATSAILVLQSSVLKRKNISILYQRKLFGKPV